MKTKLFFSILIFLVCISCNNENQLVQNQVDDTSVKEFAKQHSEILEVFFAKAKNENMKISLNPTTRSNNSNIITMDYLESFYKDYVEQTNSSNITTRSGDGVIETPELYEKRCAYLDDILPIMKNHLSSEEELENAVIKYLSSNDYNLIDDDCKENVKISLYILLDSYNYWLKNFDKWVLELYTEEDRALLEEKYNMSFGSPNTQTRMSPGDRMIWSEAAANDQAGTAWKVMKNDVYGMACSIWGGIFSGAIGWATGSIGAASGLLD